MRALIVYDSYYGNTAQVAKVMCKALGRDAEVLPVSEIKPEQLTGVELLILGSPTRAFKPTKAIQKFLDSIPGGGLKYVKVAAFDTRIAVAEVNSRLLNFLVRRFGYAAEPIAEKLQKRGGTLVSEPEGFIVKDREGPLDEGELERAEAWVRTMQFGQEQS